MALDKLHAIVSGAYELEEWHENGVVLRPPQVEGRTVAVNGTITTIFHNRSQTGKQITAVLVGNYVLDRARFAYRFQDTAIYTETAAGISVSRKPLWEGMRSFSASITASGAVQFCSDAGQHGLTFTLAGFTYWENGQTVRVWRRSREGQMTL